MKKPRYTSRPEAKIQSEIVAFLRLRGWLVEVMQGNAYQFGIPDLYLFHPDLGQKWVDVKNPARYVYTKAQCQKWPKWERAGLGVWIMMEASEPEYLKLFGPPNFREFWKPRYDKYLMEIDEIIADILDND